MTEKRGYFIAGKFDQFKQNIPYYAITQAFNEFCRSLLKESAETLQNWKSKILDAVGNNGQVIIDVIPDLELVIDAQPAVAEVGPTEAQNRFNLYFLHFFKALCDKDHPLIIFLDDLQWADLPTLNLVNLMMTDSDTQFLLFIGAYRDNEISDVHPLPRILDNMQKQTPLTNIILPPLGFSHVNNLISDSTISSLEKSKSLAKIVYEKTGGNPFFVNMFLKTIAREELVAFDFNRREWTWDVELIRSLDITNNVVDMMVDRISQLPAETRNILSLAACLGNRFNLRILSLVYGHSGFVVFDELWKAVLDGLIIPIEDDYKWIEHSPEEDHEAMFRFLHDRVQQAAYSLIPKKELSEIHLKIGRLLLKNTPADTLEEKVFDIVDQFNRSPGLLNTPDDRLEISGLNLMAGKKAKNATAYVGAIEFFKAGLELLPEDSWQSQYALTLELYKELIETEYVNTNYNQAEKLAEQTLEQVEDTLDRAKLIKLKLLISTSKVDYQGALDTGVSTLRMLGVELIDSPPSDLNIDGIINLPTMTNPFKLMAMDIMMTLIGPAYISDINMLMKLTYTTLDLSVKYGNAPASTYAYSLFGLLNITGGTIEKGFKLGQNALQVVDKLNAPEMKCRALNIHNSCIRHWKEPLPQAVEDMVDGVNSGLEYGDLENASYCAIHYCNNMLFAGSNLETLEDNVRKHLATLIKTKRQYAIDFMKITLQTILNFRLKTEAPWCLTGEAMNEDEALPSLIQTKSYTILQWFYTAKVVLNYLFDKGKDAVANAIEAEKFVPNAPGLISVGELKFYQSLALLSQYSTVDFIEREKYQAKVEENQKILSHWAEHAPENYCHKYNLIEAEKARISGHIADALKLYDKAIQGAKANNFLNEEALANELFAKFWLEQGNEKISSTYIRDAHYCYEQWGAKAKVADLEAKYSQLLALKTLHTNLTSTETVIRLNEVQFQTSKALDLESVMKASHVLSGEIVLSRLLKIMMHLLIENAGATRGLLILEKEGQWMIEAEGFVNQPF